MAERDADPTQLVRSLVAAINRRDLEAFVGHFARDYRSEQPADPERSFVGVGQVRRNWAANLSRLVDLRWDLIGIAVAGHDAWTELRWTGRAADGSWWGHQGVIVYTVRGGRIAAARLYMKELPEPKRSDASGYDQRPRVDPSS